MVSCHFFGSFLGGVCKYEEISLLPTIELPCIFVLCALLSTCCLAFPKGFLWPLNDIDIAAHTAKCSFVCQEEHAWKCLIDLAETCCNVSWVILLILQDCKLQLVLTAVQMSLQILYTGVLCVADQDIFFTYFTRNLQFSFFCD